MIHTAVVTEVITTGKGVAALAEATTAVAAAMATVAATVVVAVVPTEAVIMVETATVVTIREPAEAPGVADTGHTKEVSQ